MFWKTLFEAILGWFRSPQPTPEPPTPLTPRKTLREIHALALDPPGTNQPKARAVLEKIYNIVDEFLYPTDDPPEPVPPDPDPELIVWEDFRAEKFGFKSAMKLQHVRNFWAFDMITVALLWDGVRNPTTALQYRWKTYRGHDRSWVQDAITRCVKARADLAKLATQKKVERWYPFGVAEGYAIHKFYKGRLLDGTVTREEYEKEIKDILRVADDAAAMNGISAISQGITDGFTF